MGIVINIDLFHNPLNLLLPSKLCKSKIIGKNRNRNLTKTTNTSQNFIVRVPSSTDVWHAYSFLKMCYNLQNTHTLWLPCACSTNSLWCVRAYSIACVFQHRSKTEDRWRKDFLGFPTSLSGAQRICSVPMGQQRSGKGYPHAHADTSVIVAALTPLFTSTLLRGKTMT